MESTKRKRSYRIRFSYATATVSMTLVLFLLGAIGFTMFKLYTTSKELRENVPILVEVNDNISVEQHLAIKKQLWDSGLTKGEPKFVSKDEILKDEGFKEAFGADIEKLFGTNNPLLDHYEATLSAKSADKQALDTFVEEIGKLEGVEHVSYPKALVKELHPTLDAMQLVMLIFGGAFLLISFILLNNTILLDVYSKRELINTLKAVGATKWFIMRPFIIRCSLQGLVAGVIASTLLFGAIYSLESILPNANLVPNWGEIAIGSSIIILLGVIVAAICTLPIVNHFVNMKSNKIQIC